MEGIEEVGLADKYLGTGGINNAGVGKLIQGGDIGSFSLWVGDVGDNPLHGTGLGEVPEKGGATNYGTSTTSASGRKMGLSLLGVGNTGCWIGGGRDICPEEAEYGRAVHCDETNSRPL